MALQGVNMGASQVRGLGRIPKPRACFLCGKEGMPQDSEITGRGATPEDEGLWGGPLRPRIRTDGMFP